MYLHARTTWLRAHVNHLALAAGFVAACGSESIKQGGATGDDDPVASAGMMGDGTGSRGDSATAGATGSGGASAAAAGASSAAAPGGDTAAGGSHAGAPGGSGSDANPAWSGWWLGETDRDRNVVLHVTGDQVDAILLEIVVSLGLSSCRTSMTAAGDAPIEDSAFEGSLQLEGSDFTGTLAGQFESLQQARGTFSWEGAVLVCGSSLSFGSGWSGDGTWTASPIDCPFKDDGICDEPGLCEAGTDALDCMPEPPECDPFEDENCPCEFVDDGECDEPDLCPPGTDQIDCGGEGGAGGGGGNPPGSEAGSAGVAEGGQDAD